MGDEVDEVGDDVDADEVRGRLSPGPISFSPSNSRVLKLS